MKAYLNPAVVCIAAAFFAAVPALADTTAAGDAAAGQKVFAVCKACHQVGDKARNVVGPTLNGLFGRPAGMVEGYKYSEANRNSGVVWDEAGFREYIKDPKGFMPGNKMAYAGLKDEKKLSDLVAFLKQFAEDGTKQ